VWYSHRGIGVAEGMATSLRGNLLGIDTESDGLDPYHGDRVFCWTYHTDKGEKGFMLKDRKTLRWMEEVLNDPTKKIIFQNAKHDLKMLSFEGIDVLSLKAEIHCTLIMSKVLDSVGKIHNLRYLARRYLHRDTSRKEEVEDWIKKVTRSFKKEHGRKPNFKDAPMGLVKKRCYWDSKATLDLYKVMYPEVMSICPALYKTERRLVTVCIDMENTGVLIDITRAKELKAKALKALDSIGKELNNLVCPLTVEYKKKGKVVGQEVEEFNPGSNHHLVAAFLKLGIPLKYKTKPKKKKDRRRGGKTGGGNWCFDEYAMVRYVSKPLASIIYTSSKENWGVIRFYKKVQTIIRKHKLHKRELLPPLVLKYRQLSKLVTTYYDHLINDCVDRYITPTGREIGVLHCNFNQSEASTGRFSSSKPNLQNMPRLLGPRECFITRKGRNNWHGDYGQVEMRFYTHFGQDKKMASRLSSDLHRQTASDIYSKTPEDITKEERERAASINFGIIYGIGAETLAETLSRKGSPTTETQSRKFIKKYHTIYPCVRKTSKRLAAQLERVGYVTNPFGRRYYLPSNLGYKVLNYMCQGTSADQIKKAMVDIWYWLRANNLKSKLLMTIHDEIALEVPPSEEEIVIPKITEYMEDLHNYYVPIPVGWEVVTKRWSNKEDPEKLGFHFAA